MVRGAHNTPVALLYRHGVILGALLFLFVAFYNQRGTCEQWIKEGKGAIKWTRLSCHLDPHSPDDIVICCNLMAIQI